MHYSESAPWLGLACGCGRCWGRVGEAARKEMGRQEREAACGDFRGPRELEPLNSQYFDQYVAKPNHYAASPQIPARLTV